MLFFPLTSLPALRGLFFLLSIWCALPSQLVAGAPAAPATIKAMGLPESWARLFTINQEQYNKLRNLTEKKPVISEGRLITNGYAAMSNGFSSLGKDVSSGWQSLLRVVGLRPSAKSDASNATIDEQIKGQPLCMLKTRESEAVDEKDSIINCVVVLNSDETINGSQDYVLNEKLEQPALEMPPAEKQPNLITKRKKVAKGQAKRTSAAQRHPVGLGKAANYIYANQYGLPYYPAASTYRSFYSYPYGYDSYNYNPYSYVQHPQSLYSYYGQPNSIQAVDKKYLVNDGDDKVLEEDYSDWIVDYDEPVEYAEDLAEGSGEELDS